MKHPTDCGDLILFTALRSYALFSSRRGLMNDLIKLKLSVAAASTGDEFLEALYEMGVSKYIVEYTRGGLNPLKDMVAIFQLRRCFEKSRPALVHCFQLKPLLFTVLAGGLPKKTRIVATITGIGALFGMLHSKWAGWFIQLIFRISLGRCDYVIFQNPDDQALFRKKNIIPEGKSKIFPGSGVDLSRFHINQESENETGPIRVFMASRLLWSKGVKEYYQAAEICNQHNRNIIFEIAGEFDKSHQDGVPEEWFKRHSSGAVLFIGYIKDVPEKLRKVDILVLPSTYREGVPRILLEGAACGIPVVTVDAPGCREAVINRETGLIVPPKNPEALADAIMTLAKNRSKRTEMGRRARILAEDKFDIKKVNELHLEVYKKLGMEINPV